MLLGAIKSGEIAHKKKLERIKNHKQFCKQCNKPIPYEKRRNIFCSSRCAINDHNPKRSKCSIKSHISKQNKFECVTCLECGVKTWKLKNQTFCSLQCNINYKWKLKKKQIEKGLIPYRPRLRKYLIEKHGKTCSICKLTEWMEKEIPLDLDHIDGNSENNLPENLRLVCLNCHGQTPTFKGKNKGNGRKYRRIGH